MLEEQLIEETTLLFEFYVTVVNELDFFVQESEGETFNVTKRIFMGVVVN